MNESTKCVKRGERLTITINDQLMSAVEHTPFTPILFFYHSFDLTATATEEELAPAGARIYITRGIGPPRGLSYIRIKHWPPAGDILGLDG